MLLPIARFVAGLALGVWIWWAAAPAYNRLLAPATELLLHADRRLAAAALVPQGREVFVTSSTPLPTATMPADQLTYNIILLLALFASNTHAWSRANLRALAIAMVILFVSHCAGLLISIESTYAVRQGAWSEQHYSDTAGSFWLMTELVFRTVGMFGIVFAAWWKLSYAKSVST
jgi:hypothetical protein